MARLSSVLLLLVLGACSGSASPSNRQDVPRDLLKVTAAIVVPSAGNLVPTSDLVWVMEGPSGVIAAIDPETNQVVHEVTLPHPAPYGFYNGHSLWISSFADNLVMQVDAESGRLVRTIRPSREVPVKEPVGAVVTGHDLWVLSHQPAWLSRFDARTGEPISATRLPGDNAGGPELAGGQLWVSLTRQGRMLRIDPATGRQAGAPVRLPHGLCIGSAHIDDTFWVTSEPFGGFDCERGTSRVDVTTGEVTDVPAGADRTLYSVASLGGEIWADDLHNHLYRLDDDGASLTPALTLEGRPEVTVLVSAFGSIWGGGGGNGSVQRLDLP